MPLMIQLKDKTRFLKTARYVLGGMLLGGLGVFGGWMGWGRDSYHKVLEQEQAYTRDRLEEKENHLAYWQTRLDEWEARLKQEQQALLQTTKDLAGKAAVIHEFERKKDISLGRTWASMSPENASRIMDHLPDETLLRILLDIDPYHRGKILSCYAALRDTAREPDYYPKRAARLTDQFRKVLETKTSDDTLNHESHP